MKRLTKKWAAPVLCGLLIFLLFQFVLFIGYVPTASMEPAIRAGACVVGHRFIGEIGRGDILVFRHEGRLLVKRVVAMPSDVVYIDDAGSVHVNVEPQDASRMLIVPEGCYFMLGDNSVHSVDSRMWDPPFVERGQVVARLR